MLSISESSANQHFIEANTDIDYQIGFQNTGNDTAFAVVLRDTLDAALDPTTIRTGASSHIYTWTLSGKNVLTFQFDNINLLDSFRNEAKSHGFVKFRIAQKKDLPIGTRIENKAAIYFDFNAPIVTNKTFHTIGKDFLSATIEQEFFDKVKISVAPNPFGNSTIFSVQNIVPSQFPRREEEGVVFTLFDMNGRLLRSEKFDGNQFEFFRKDLPTGIFIFKISTADGQPLGIGKIVAR